MNAPFTQYGIRDTVALVTGTNRGIGAAFVDGLLAAGARKVYAATRRVDGSAPHTDPRVVPVVLDVTREETIVAATRAANDVTLLVNNAGIIHGGGLLTSAGLEGAREEMEVNYFGLLRMCRKFAPVLAANGGGVILNVLSVLAHAPLPRAAGYSASKAATLSLTRSLRAELTEQGTRVVGVLPGFVATRMTEGLDVPKASPEEIVLAALAAVESGEEEVYPDAAARQWVEREIRRQVEAVRQPTEFV